MKKVLLTAVAVFSLTFVNAQEEKETTGVGFSKGDVFVSGAFSLTSTNNKNTDVKTSGFEIEPKVGYFVSDKIAVGAKLGYASDKSKNATADLSDDSTMSVGLFGRYYTTPASQFSLFGQLGFDYISVKDNMSGGMTVNGWGVAFAPGVNYFVSDNWAIEATIGNLGYGSAKADVTGAKEVSAFDLSLDLRAISFGVNYKF
jgi:outer membrane protein W